MASRIQDIKESEVVGGSAGMAHLIHHLLHLCSESILLSFWSGGRWDGEVELGLRRGGDVVAQVCQVCGGLEVDFAVVGVHCLLCGAGAAEGEEAEERDRRRYVGTMGNGWYADLRHKIGVTCEVEGDHGKCRAVHGCKSSIWRRSAIETEDAPGLAFLAWRVTAF